MPDLADKPFMNVLAEDVRINPRLGLLGNINENLTRASDKVDVRTMNRNRAWQLNQAMQEWQRDQAALRQRAAQPYGQPPAPGLFEAYKPL